MSLRDVRSTEGRRAFGRGFHQRSPLVLAAAGLLLLAFLALLQPMVFDGGLTWVNQGRLLRIGHDDYVHVSVEVQDLKKDPPKTRTVYLFGGSGAMECIVSESSLAAAISRDAGQPVRVVSLAAHQESMAMTLALVDNLPPGPATLAIGLAPIRVTGKPSRDAALLSGHTLLVRSKRLDELAPKFFGEKPPETGAIPGIFDYLGSYLKQRAADGPFWGREIAYQPHYYPVGAVGQSPLGKRRNVLYVLAKDVTLYRLYGGYNFAMLEQILRLARDRGYDVVFYDQPPNASAAGPDWAGVVPAYRERAETLARRWDVPYLHVERHVKLQDSDFADLFHLLAPARLKWQPVMARELAATLPRATAPMADAATLRGGAVLRGER
jgi:hypothetical protein